VEPEDRRLLNEIHGSVSGIGPLLKTHGDHLLRLDDRTRALEAAKVEHEVKAVRLQQDLDGLGRKVRGLGEKRLTASQAPENTGSRWLAFLEVLAAAPKWVHAIVSIGSFAGLAATLLWKHWPR
jgi:heme oxygenase